MLELYRRVSETKRVPAEVDRRLYEIRSVGTAMQMQPEDLAAQPLKELGCSCSVQRAIKGRWSWIFSLSMLLSDICSCL